MFGGFGGGGGRQGPQQTEDIMHQIAVSLEDLYNGVSKKLRITKENKNNIYYFYIIYYLVTEQPRLL